MDNNLYGENGAERIGKNHPDILNLCKKFWLKLIPHDQDFLCNVHAHWRTKKITHNLTSGNNKKLEKFISQFVDYKDKKIKKYDKYSLEDLFLHIFSANSSDLEIEELLNTNEYGDSMKNISWSKFIIDLIQWADTDAMDYKIDGWNDLLIKKIYTLLEELWVVFHTWEKIIDIQKKKKTYFVSTQHNVFSADFVICSLPIKAMSMIKRHKLLPKKKMSYIHSIGYWNIFKRGSFFETEKKKFGYCDDSMLHTVYDAWYWQYKNQKEKKLIWVYATWERAMLLSKKTNNELYSNVSESLGRNKEIQDIDSVLEKACYGHYRWWDEFTHWAYAVFAPWTYRKWIKAFAKKSWKIYFCWEHTSLYYQWFMNWAIESWLRVAKDILSIMRLDSKE